MKKITSVILIFVLTAVLFSSCGSYELVTSGEYADFKLQEQLNIEFPDEPVKLVNKSDDIPEISEEQINYVASENKNGYIMRVVDKIRIYSTTSDLKPTRTLHEGELVILRDTGGEWAEVYNFSGHLIGYTNEGYLRSINASIGKYAELPIEYGKARTNSGSSVNAYSHLVDVSKYLNVYYSTEYSNEGVDLSKYDVKVSMKLSTNETSIGEPFYNSNLCLLQYDTLQKFINAIKMFKEDGYTVVIYDAYRPTSVQQRWFDVVKVHKWVANPAIGMGGVHDRGTAIDMSLIDSEGNELEMPTPMHTFTEASARNSTEMTETARANMDYMLSVMVSCGFTYINSEWWHFQDVNTAYYLPTDHPIDEIPLEYSESEVSFLANK